MGAKRTAKKAAKAKKTAAPEKAALPKKRAAAPKKKAATPKKKAAAPKRATRKTGAAKAQAPSTQRGASLRRQRRRAPTQGLSPEDLAARIAATGLVSTAYVLPWEPIHGPGDYAAIARAIGDLAGGELPIEDVSDQVDLAGEQASVELSLDGVCHVIDAHVDGARVDDGFLVMLTALFDRRQEAQPQETRRWFFVDPVTCKAAKTYLLICATFDAMFAVNDATGAGFIRVSEL